jgi:ABC-2 type transport system permease protein
MKNITSMLQRELGAYFLSPIAYVVAATFLFTSGLAFGLGTFNSGGTSSLQPLLDPWIVMILLFVLPMLTMRLLSEELRSGTIETLMTVPITDTEVVLGKYFGAMVFYVILLAALLLYPVILAVYGEIDIPLLLCNYLGLLLLGALFNAVGLFFSALSRHEVIAVLLGLTLLTFMTFAFDGLSRLLDGWPRTLLQQLSIRTHFMDFIRGMVTVNHLVFFLSVTALFLFLTVKLLESRRWQ